jgi:hypothetical protein
MPATAVKAGRDKRRGKGVQNKMKVSRLVKERKEDLQIAGAREEPTNRGSIDMEYLNATPNALG